MSKADGKSSARTSRPVAALLAGLAATALAIAAHLAGLDRQSELYTLDLRFHHLSTAGPTDEIVHVDIDDNSLQQVGRWPWPRRQLAGVVDILTRCGARTVAMDIEMPEPQELRFATPSDEAYAKHSEIINLVPPQFDDDDLRNVFETHESVFLPMHFAPTDKPTSPSDLTEQIRHRLKEALAGGQALSFEHIKLEVLHQDRNSSSAPATMPAASLPTEFEKELRSAYLRARSLLAMERFAIDPRRISGFPLRQGPLTTPLVIFAQRIHHSGFVTFVPDLDGTVRYIPPLARSGNEIYPQFAFAVAAHELGRRHVGEPRWSADASRVQLSFPDGFARDIPVDNRGMVLINWMRAKGRTPAVHRSAGAIVSVWRIEDIASQALRLKRAYQMKLAMALDSHTLLDLFQDAAGLRIARQQEDLYGKSSLQPALSGIRTFKEMEAEIDRQIEYMRTDDLAKETQTDRDRKALAQYNKDLASLPSISSKDQERLRADMESLRKAVSGKICLIGSTATGAADFVPTPMDPRMPGVQVHANIVNTILTGNFVRQAPWWLSALAILLAGLAVTLLAAWRPLVTQAAPAMLVLAAAFVAFDCYIVFGRWSYWLPLVAPMAAMLASFLAVAVCRQLTEERAKKHIRGMFAHALSPALVDRLIEDPSMMELGQRELTCFFSDLAGFTPMAERLGEQGTARVLRRYFDRVTEIIQNRRGGYLNKFLGDGIFVFFGAPVLQADHASRAVAAALECQKELEQLNAQLAGEFDPPLRIRMRIGLATGKVMVGDCGSTDKQDYTAIGPTVNLASRLEGANKFFHTNVLAADSTYQQAGPDQWLARPLGKVLVVGTTEPVEVWQPLARRADAPDNMVRACDLSAQALKEFNAGDFTAAGKAFQSVLEILPDDYPATMYLELCSSHAAAPPPGDWRVLKLTEK